MPGSCPGVEILGSVHRGRNFRVLCSQVLQSLCTVPAEYHSRSPAANPVAKLKPKVKRVRRFPESNSKKTTVRKCQRSEDEKTSSMPTTTVVPDKFSSRGQQYSVEEQRILLDHVLDSERLKAVESDVWKPAFWQTVILPGRSARYLNLLFTSVCLCGVGCRGSASKEKNNVGNPTTYLFIQF